MESVELMWKDSPEDGLICVAVLGIFIIITKRYVRCWDEYDEQIKSVKYIVIDMFDYTYFNYDVLMASECESYLESSGFFG